MIFNKVLVILDFTTPDSANHYAIRLGRKSRSEKAPGQQIASCISEEAVFLIVDRSGRENIRSIERCTPVRTSVGH
nr:hypothetical protein [Nakamurella panacisegetis]